MSPADRLAARTLELIDVPSGSRDEAALAAHVLDVLRSGGVDARDAGDTCVLAGTPDRSERPLVLLAGHLDTLAEKGVAPDRTVRGLRPRPGGRRHEGRRRGDDRSRACPARGPGEHRRRLRLLRSRGAAVR